MKKLIILAALVVAGVAANAASFKWSATNIYSPTDNTALYSGTASLFCDAIGTDALSVGTIADGKIASTTFSSALFEAGTKYDFYFVIEAGAYTYTSNIKAQTANATTSPTIGFGSQQTNPQLAINTPGGWQSVPEPTSGLLLLLGMAGLALKRKRA